MYTPGQKYKKFQTGKRINWRKLLIFCGGILLVLVVGTVTFFYISNITKAPSAGVVPTNVNNEADKQKAAEAAAAKEAVRKLSEANISTLMQQYAQTHTGTFSISMSELSGQLRQSSYNPTKLFISASTYKLFAAYSTLKRVEDGTWNLADKIVGGRDLATCFNDMIVNSDNDCAEAFLNKIGRSVVTSEAHSIGCNSTIFSNTDYARTSAADLTLFLTKLYQGQILTQQSSRDRLINAMKRQVYRQGIPAGLKGIVVADKVGFINAVLNDAAIVYSPTGTYILVIMTDGSSWSTIADLANKIEALRIQSAQTE